MFANIIQNSLRAASLINAAAAYTAAIEGRNQSAQPLQNRMNPEDEATAIQHFRNMTFAQFVDLMQSEPHNAATNTNNQNGRFIPNEEARNKVRRNLLKEFW